jgi:hypothetical protein
MALNHNHRLAVFATIAESLRLTWALRVPYLVMVMLAALPGTIAVALGLLDPMKALMAIDETSGYGPLADFPFGTLALFWLGGILIVVVYAIFWYRYILLGPAGALKFGVAAFNGMLWRSLGGGLVVAATCLVVVLVTVTATALLGGTAMTMLGLEQGVATVILMILMIVVGYGPPLALALRMSLIFPAIALGEKFTLAESWSATRGSTGRMLGAILAVVAPTMALLMALNFGIFFALGFDILEPEGAWAAIDYWWISLALAPLGYLPMTLFCTIVAIGFRDLSGSGTAPQLSGQQSLAH